MMLRCLIPDDACLLACVPEKTFGRMQIIRYLDSSSSILGVCAKQHSFPSHRYRQFRRLYMLFRFSSFKLKVDRKTHSSHSFWQCPPGLGMNDEHTTRFTARKTQNWQARLSLVQMCVSVELRLLLDREGSPRAKLHALEPLFNPSF